MVGELGRQGTLAVWRTAHPWYEKRKGRPVPLVSLMLASGLAMASFGFGCAMSIHTGDIALTTMALSGIMGVMAGVATRWAALPRPALATMIRDISKAVARPSSVPTRWR